MQFIWEAGAALEGRDASGAPAREAPFLPPCSDIQSPRVPAGVTAVQDKNLIFKQKALLLTLLQIQLEFLKWSFSGIKKCILHFLIR